MIEYSEFLNDVASHQEYNLIRDDKSKTKDYCDPFTDIMNMNCSQKISLKDLKNIHLNETIFLVHTYDVGGTHGSGYGGSNPKKKKYKEPNPDKEFKSLNEILEKYTDISYLTYKRITGELIKKGEFTIYEYYGNATHSRFKAVNLPQLFETIKNEMLFKSKFLDDSFRIEIKKEKEVDSNKTKSTIKK